MSAPVQSYRIEPGQSLSGEIIVPGDKSISHRAVMLGSIARGTTTVRGFLDSEDCRATLAAFQQMGVDCQHLTDGTLEIHGVGRGGLEAPPSPLDLGNSGTAIRLLMGLLTGQGVSAELTGDESLRSRPMDRIATPLRSMGAQIDTRAGKAPVRIRPTAQLNAIRYELPVASAQIKSAVLLAGLGAEGRTEVVSPGPSRDHTERMLESMGVKVDVSDNGLRVGLDGPAELIGTDIRVPGDLSSAAFFIVGACLGARDPVVLKNVGINPTRDGLLTILRRMGARIELDNLRSFGSEPVADIRVLPGPLTGIEVPPAWVPLAIDELPVIFVAAAAARGRTVVSGAGELRVKESDRLAAMAKALRAVGASLEETPDGMIIDGGQIHGGAIDTAGDHRIAMSFAIASLVSQGPITIRDTGPVATSFPDFVDVASRATLDIQVSES
jgi:3-phosphoshikimate 1-carboxyvinyltransferase